LGEISIFDKAGIVKEPTPSEAIENERRLFYVAVTRARESVLIGTSSPSTRGSQGNSSPARPSRFLVEMELEPTVEIMSSLQRFASGVSEARNELLAQIVKFGGIKKIINNLVTEYLSGGEHRTFAHEIESVAARIPESAFAYPMTYNAPSIAVPVPPQPENIPWWDEEGLDFRNTQYSLHHDSVFKPKRRANYSLRPSRYAALRGQVTSPFVLLLSLSTSNAKQTTN
jgi:hypothetical protein